MALRNEIHRLSCPVVSIRCSTQSRPNAAVRQWPFFYVSCWEMYQAIDAIRRRADPVAALTGRAGIDEYPMSKQLRVGLVGTGYVSQHHLRALKKLDYVQVAALCDSNLDRATKAAKQAGIARATGVLTSWRRSVWM